MKVVIALLFLWISYETSTAQEADSVVMAVEIDSLIRSNRQLIDNNQFDEALPKVEALKSRILISLGKNNNYYAECAHQYAWIWFKKRDLNKAEEWFKEAVAVREKIFGIENIEYAHSLFRLASVYWFKEQYADAATAFQEVKDIRRKVLGEAHPDYIVVLLPLAAAYLKLQQYDEAIAIDKELIELTGKIKGKESKEYVESLEYLAEIYGYLGQSSDEEPLRLEQRNVVEKILGKNNIDYLKATTSLGALNLGKGNYEASEAYLLEAKAISEQIGLKKSKENARILNNLGVLYNETAKYKESEISLLEAISIRKKILGEKHLDYAESIANLSNLYFKMGLYEEAEKYALRAIVIQETTSGKDSPSYAKSLINLANIYQSTGRNTEAEDFMKRGIAILENKLGKEHPTYLTSMSNLAAFYEVTGQYSEAEDIFKQVINIASKSIGRQHPVYALYLNNLGSLYQAMGDYKAAEITFLDAKSILEKIPDNHNPDYLRCLNNLASLYFQMNRFAEAADLFLDVRPKDRSNLKKASLFLSAYEMASHTQQFLKNQDDILVFAAHPAAATGDVLAACYDDALFYKGYILNTYGQMRNLFEQDSVAMKKSSSLASTYRQLEKLLALPAAARDSNLLINLKNQANDLEKDLARSVRDVGDIQQEIDWKAVQAHLQPEAAAIEFVQYNTYNQLGRAADSVNYAALLLLPGANSPIFIPLFQETLLDSLLKSTGSDQISFLNQVYASESRGLTPVKKINPGKQIYSLLWQPIEAALQEKGIQKIYYAPAGILHRLNLDAIALSKDSTIADRYHLVRLTSTRELVIPAQRKGDNNDALLLGGIQYDMDTAAISVANAGLTDTWTSRSKSEMSFKNMDSTLYPGTWKYLPFTQNEVRSVDSILEKAHIVATVKTGYEATEEVLKSYGNSNKPSPRILHIATHGYCFPDPEKGNIRALDDVNHPAFKFSDDPMIRSGLILAGGNAAWQHQSIPGTPEDGILTAYEISHLNLQNTELVVLSACETGLGDILGNEGVYGLQRAFKIAGVKYLIMSLWEVPDKQTAELMSIFYKKWLEENMAVPDAFRSAQKEMRERGLEPYYWAGFVLVE